jgi:hypothetical protein
MISGQGLADAFARRIKARGRARAGRPFGAAAPLSQPFNYFLFEYPSHEN